MTLVRLVSFDHG
jgi:hypothetical protein